MGLIPSLSLRPLPPLAAAFVMAIVNRGTSAKRRVRQIESRALLKLRQPQNRCRVKDYLGSLD